MPAGNALACEAATNCTYVAVTGRPAPDTNDWTPSSIGGANNADRYFTDYNGAGQCFNPNSTTQRCWSTGNSLNHVLIPNFSIWVRELPVTAEAIITYPLDENMGTAVGDTSGNARNATTIAGSWTPGHTGSSFLGAFRTNAAVPVSSAATVSMWVRRDGAGTAYPRILGWTNDAFELADLNHGNDIGVYTPAIGWRSTGSASAPASTTSPSPSSAAATSSSTRTACRS